MPLRVVLHVVRHGHAGRRRDWDGDDRARPLSPRGIAQAQGVAAGIGPVGRLLSSPFERCRQTLGPLAELSGCSIELVSSLAEGGSAATVMAAMDELVADGRVAALCTHGDVVQELIWALELSGVELSPDQGHAKGSVWSVEYRDGDIVSASYAAPSEVSVDRA